MSEELKLFKVEFEVRETVIYSIHAEDESDAIDLAHELVESDHGDSVKYIHSWEV